MGIKEEQLQTKGAENIFNKVLGDKFPNLEKEIVNQI
jgi:hypothetical protein